MAPELKTNDPRLHKPPMFENAKRRTQMAWGIMKMKRDDHRAGYVQSDLSEADYGALGTVAQTIGKALGRFAKKTGFQRPASSKAPRNLSTNTTSGRKSHVKKTV